MKIKDDYINNENEINILKEEINNQKEIIKEIKDENTRLINSYNTLINTIAAHGSNIINSSSSEFSLDEVV